MKITTYTIEKNEYDEYEIQDVNEIDDVIEIDVIPITMTETTIIQYRIKNKEYKIFQWDELKIPINHHLKIDKDK